MLEIIVSSLQKYPLVAGAGLGVTFLGIIALLPKRKFSQNQLQALSAKHQPVAGFVQKKLLTPNELHFFKRLQVAAGATYLVLPQVGLGALIDTILPEGNPHREFERRKFVGKLLDFVVADAQTLQVRFVIELDDRTHNKLKDANRDQFLLQAGIKTLRYESTAKPSVEQLQVDFERIAS